MTWLLVVDFLKCMWCLRKNDWKLQALGLSVCRRLQLRCRSAEEDIAAEMLDSLYVSLDWCNSTLLLLHHPSCNLCNFSLWRVAVLTSRDNTYSVSALVKMSKLPQLWLVNRSVTASQQIFHGSADTQFPKELWQHPSEHFVMLIYHYLWLFSFCSSPAWSARFSV